VEPGSDILDIISTRKAAGEPFALATVVRTVAATAAKAGAKAVILADGTISEGWIGGGCARAAVLKAARDALADGRPRLVSVLPPSALDQQGVKAGHDLGALQDLQHAVDAEAAGRELQDLQKAQGATGKGGQILTAEQQAELERFRKRVAETRIELKEVRKNLRQDAESLVFWTKVVNIALMPILVALFGVGVALIRRRRVRAA